MNKKLKRLHLIGITIGAICIVSTSVFAVNLANKPKEEPKEENQVKVIDAKDIPQLIGEKEETYEEWESRMENSNKLPREKELELYNQGYDFYDIQVAEDLAGLCGKTPEELLELKGKTQYTVEGGEIKENSTPWSQITSQLNINIQKPTQALGITPEQIEEMKSQGLKEDEIEQVAILSFNYRKDYKDIVNEIKQGKTVKDLKKQYWEKNREEAREKKVSDKDAKENTERVLKKQYNITDEEIEKCKSKGVSDIVEIAMAKDIAIKNNMKLEKVLEIKKDRKDWEKVNEEAEVRKYEK